MDINGVRNPLAELATNDPGDETQRNYRYQHAYGAILLIGASAKKLPYSSVYAEHHEDFLCERLDGKFDGYQIKTRKPEEGLWELSDEPLKKSIKRFVELQRKFNGFISEVQFVSNVDHSSPSSDIKDERRLRNSPIRFTEHICKCASHPDIQEPFRKTFQELLEYCECEPDELFVVIKRIGFLRGPDRNSFDAEICATHLPRLSECVNLTPSQIAAIKDELIQKVHYASSLMLDDPSKHWTPVNKISNENPIIKAKKILIDEVLRTITDKTAPPFRYCSAHPTLKLGEGQGNIAVLREKMIHGDLAQQVSSMERRSLSAEQRLMEIAVRKPANFDTLLTQLVSVVQGECDEAYLQAKLSEKTIGPQMLNDVYRRLKDKASSSMVEYEPYETLVGIAGLLTGECSVWWSEKFPLEGAK